MKKIVRIEKNDTSINRFEFDKAIRLMQVFTVMLIVSITIILQIVSNS